MQYTTTIISLKEFSSALVKAGCSLRRNALSISNVTWVDSRGGALYTKKYRLFKKEAACHVTRKGISIDPGNAGKILKKILGSTPPVACLSGKVTERIYTLSSKNYPPFGISYQAWRFNEPLDRGHCATAIICAPLEPEHSEQFNAILGTLTAVFGFQKSGADILELGLQSLELPMPGVPKLAEYIVSVDDSILSAGRKILAYQACKLRANRQGALHDIDPEYVHDLRVASRRARFALKILKQYAVPDECDKLRKELRRCASVLGRMRDMDVLVNMLELEIDSVHADAEAAQQVTAHLEQTRKAQHTELVDLLRSELFISLPVSMETFPLETPDGTLPGVCETAPAVVQAAMAALLSWLQNMAEPPSATELHRTRILFKRLRYTCEYFSDPYGKKMKKFIRSLVAFQDCLGAHQDACVAIDMLTRMAHELIPRAEQNLPLAFLFGVLIERQNQKIQDSRLAFAALRKKLPRLIEKITGMLNIQTESDEQDTASSTKQEQEREHE